jgi:hypothetical protein
MNYIAIPLTSPRSAWIHIDAGRILGSAMTEATWNPALSRGRRRHSRAEIR